MLHSHLNGGSNQLMPDSTSGLVLVTHHQWMGNKINPSSIQLSATVPKAPGFGPASNLMVGLDPVSCFFALPLHQ